MYKKSILIGCLGALGLLSFYFITMRLLGGSWEAATYQFQKLWVFMIILISGFGVQTGLYYLVRTKTGSRIMGANTTVSGLGMIVCCAHHLSDVLPILGLSVLSTFLLTYQTPILILGILSNALGIIYLLRIIRHI